MEGNTLENLIKKYLEDKATIEEIKQLEKWYNSFESGADLYVPGSVELEKIVAKRFSELKFRLGLIKQLH
ncbi:MAG: hypothetical protein ABIN94_16945 [Ferruginibacter sp.]